MYLFQDEQKELVRMYTHMQFVGIRIFDSRDFNQARIEHKYDFHMEFSARKPIMKIEWSKQVEKHLTEINYLGI